MSVVWVKMFGAIFFESAQNLKQSKLLLSKKIPFVRFVFLENEENSKKITCPNDLDKNLADHLFK